MLLKVSFFLEVNSSKFVDQTSICEGLRLDLLSERNQQPTENPPLEQTCSMLAKI